MFGHFTTLMKRLIPSMLAFCLHIYIDITDLLGAAHISHRTVSIVTAQTICHVALDQSNRNRLASLATVNQWNFAYLKSKLWRKS